MIADWPRWLTSPDNNPTTTTRQQPGDNLQPTYAHTHTYTHIQAHLYSSWSGSARACWPLTLASESEWDSEPEPGPGSVCLHQISAENHFNCAQFVAIVGASHSAMMGVYATLSVFVCVCETAVCVCVGVARTQTWHFSVQTIRPHGLQSPGQEVNS